MRGRGRVTGALAAALTLLGAGGAQAASAPHIVGGGPASQAYPYVVSVTVRYPSGVAASCGGTLVAARYVVTAGHCVASDLTLGGNPSGADVVIGARNLLTDTSAERMTGVAIIRNPAFSDGGFGGTGAPRNDVAVLRLPTPSAKAQAQLPRASDSALWAPGVTALALGYGLTRPDDDSSASPELQQVDLPIAADSACQAAYGNAYDASDLCAGGVAGKDTCQGDSGGPLLVPGPTTAVLAGVTSYGDQCGRTYGVYAETGGSVSGFLRANVAQVEIDPPAGTPVAGQDATFTATGNAPGGTGPFGGYDQLAWDLDGDGAFDDATGATATTRLAAGTRAISVLATDGLGDRETRTISVTAQALAARLTVSAKRIVRPRSRAFRISAKPNQAGRLTATLKRGSRTLGRAATVRATTTKARRLVVRLSRAAARDLRRAGRRRAVLRVTLTPAAGGASRTVRRTVLLRS